MPALSVTPLFFAAPIRSRYARRHITRRARALLCCVNVCRDDSEHAHAMRARDAICAYADACYVAAPLRFLFLLCLFAVYVAPRVIIDELFLLMPIAARRCRRSLRHIAALRHVFTMLPLLITLLLIAATMPLRCLCRALMRCRDAAMLLPLISPCRAIFMML